MYEDKLFITENLNWSNIWFIKKKSIWNSYNKNYNKLKVNSWLIFFKFNKERNEKFLLNKI